MRCLERIALRQCTQQCGEANESDHGDAQIDQTSADVQSAPRSGAHHGPSPLSGSRKRKREACITHSRSARDRYGTILARLGCICRELIAQRLEPCCRESRLAQRRSLTPNTSKETLRSLISSAPSPVVTPPGNCCHEKQDEKAGRAVRGSNTGCCNVKDPSPRVGHDGNDSKKCSVDEKTAQISRNPCQIGAASCASDGKNAGGSACARSGNGDCCMPVDTKVMHQKSVTNIDLEAAPANLQHVILDVQGLTCTGCETKLSRSLQGIPGLHHLQTSLVLSQAEFDLDEKTDSVEAVIKSVEKATGFTCQRVNNEGQEIDIMVEGDAKVFVSQKYPLGVSQMTAVGKHKVRILYDGRRVGARTLLDRCFNDPVTIAAPRQSPEFESGRKHVRNMAWMTLLSTVLTIPVLIMAWAPLPHRPIAYGSASLVLATVVQFVVAGPFYPSALRALLFTHVIEIDLLIVLSTSTAYLFSLVSFTYMVLGRPLSVKQFFETSTLLITLIILGRLVSAFARQRAVESVSIRSLQEGTATLCTADGLGDERIDVRLLQYGDYFKVQPYSRVATDGVVVSGTTEIDESMVTGESLPVEKPPGSVVIAGSMNGSGTVVLRLTHLPGDNTVSTIANMVDQAKFSKPKTQAVVDIVASYFVPVILLLTVIIFAVWMAVGVAVRRQSGGQAAVTAITYALSVLIISCPCAIGLAVPMVVVIAGGVAAKHGIVFKSATTIESARNISHVVFDKTGTLTEGRLSVDKEAYLSTDANLAAALTLALTRDDRHPVAVALASHLKAKNIDAVQIEEVKSIVGKGIQGTFRGMEVRCGNTRWSCVDEHPSTQELLATGSTVVGVTLDHELVALFGLTDSLRSESQSVVTELHKRNIDVSIISGDDAGAVDAIAAQLGIPSSNVRSRCAPADKQGYLQTLHESSPKTITLFCGDGTNDAVALAQAHIGVHIGSLSTSPGSDIASTAADATLLRPDLRNILTLLDLSRAAFYRICLTFIWAFTYNLLAILLASGALTAAGPSVRIEPQYAGLGEIVSVLPVILIALQLKTFKGQY